MCFSIVLDALIWIIIDSLNKLITALCDVRSLTGKDELQKWHEHPDGYNGEEDTTQDKECVKQYASLVLG